MEIASRLKRAIGTILGPLIGLLIVLAIFGTWRPHSFFSPLAFGNVFRGNYQYVVAAVGATFVIVTAGIDLSVGSTMALACVACAMTINGFHVPAFDWGQASALTGISALTAGLCAAGNVLRKSRQRVRAAAIGLIAAIVAGAIVLIFWKLIAGCSIAPAPIWLGVLAGVAVGGAVGWLNGMLITMLSLPPFIITLATLEAVRGVALYITDAIPVGNMPASMRSLHYDSWLLGLPGNVWIALLVAIIAAPVLHFTVLGRYAFAIGSNERTARLCGVPVERYKTYCYLIAGLCAGIAGVMMAAQFGSGYPDEFKGTELTVIAAVVIGGTSLFGGEGTIIGSVLGVLMLGFLYSGCNIANISPFVQRVFIGGTIVLAAAADRFRHLGR